MAFAHQTWYSIHADNLDESAKPEFGGPPNSRIRMKKSLLGEPILIREAEQDIKVDKLTMLNSTLSEWNTECSAAA
jgi:hypothetical protein